MTRNISTPRHNGYIYIYRSIAFSSFLSLRSLSSLVYRCCEFTPGELPPITIASFYIIVVYGTEADRRPFESPGEYAGIRNDLRAFRERRENRSVVVATPSERYLPNVVKRVKGNTPPWVRHVRHQTLPIITFLCVRRRRMAGTRHVRPVE